MRFLHTADWHLGRQLKTYSLLDDQRRILEELLTLVSRKNIDAVVIAGDVYDRRVPPEEAVELFDAFVTGLVREQGKKLLFIAGNHDSDERLAFAARIMEQAGVYAGGRFTADPAPVVLHDEYGAVYFSLLPYIDPPVIRSTLGIEENLSFDAAMRRAVDCHRAKIPAGARSVVVAHAFITGGAVSDSERPLTVGGAGNIGADAFAAYQYAALGHLHMAQAAAGMSNVRYSGSPLKYSLNEYNQPKSFTLVDMAADGSVSVELIPVVPRRELRVLENMTLAEMIAAGADDPARDDYIWAKPADRDPVFGAMDQLQKIYPHALHIDWPNRVYGQARSVDRRFVELAQEKRFEWFYEETVGRAMNEDEEKILRETLAEMRREGK